MLDPAIFLGVCLSTVAIALLFILSYALDFLDWIIESGLFLALIFAFLMFIDYIY